eukprot:5726831-Pyramimonas_sp.AAC.1
MGVVLHAVFGLHPHQFSIVDAPRQPGLFDRKAWSHLGFCYDVELGKDARNLVYDMTWAALVWVLGLGTPWNDESLAAPADSLPPLPKVRGISHRPKGANRFAPPEILHQFPGAWSADTGK